jgi:hypothetical protein
MAHAKGPRNCRANTILLASITAEGMTLHGGGREQHPGSVRSLCRTSVRTDAVTQADHGDMDDLAAYKGERLTELIEQ